MAQKPDSSLRNRISELGASPKSYFSKTSTEPKPILDLLGKRQCGLEACVHTSLAKTISSFLTVCLQRIPKIPFVVLFPHRSSTCIFLMSSSALGPEWLYKVALAQQHFEMFSWCMFWKEGAHLSWKDSCWSARVLGHIPGRQRGKNIFHYRLFLKNSIL